MVVENTGRQNESGVFFWLKRLTAQIFWKYGEYTRKKRFNFYDVDGVDLYAMGTLVNVGEWHLELPQDESSLAKALDNICFYGVDTSGTSLAVQFSRKENGKASLFIYFHLADGTSYALPQQKTSFPVTGDNRSFYAGGLKIQCLSPMRKWRLSFNGLLQELQTEQPEVKLVHAKFGFIWTPMSTIFDAAEDIVLSNVASGLASEKWNGYFPDIHRLQLALNSYEQDGQLLGTVKIEDGQEQEMYLWTSRVKTFDCKEAKKDHKACHIYGYTENGFFFHIARIDIPGLTKNLITGHVTTACGYTHAIECCSRNTNEFKVEPDLSGPLEFSAGGRAYTLEITSSVAESAHTCDGLSQEIRICPITLNGDKGMSHYILEHGVSLQSATSAHLQFPMKASSTTAPLVVAISNMVCQDSLVTGGKGSSLARLKTVTEKNETLFSVPNGVVVTTEAYRYFISEPKIQAAISKLERISGTEQATGLEEMCSEVVNVISSSVIPDPISDAVSSSLLSEFGNAAHGTLFAVRSSASEEDTENMSAAGQMDTFLGVKGIDQVLASLPSCWASQFAYVATGYKRRYGQALNSPMAVVIQEMVPSEVAGVMFTCNPVTGNPSVITITANYGLGESVVSSMAEPDTIELKRDHKNALSIVSISVGSKKLRITMDESGGTKKDHNETVQDCCLSDTDAITLGEIGIQVENEFGSPLDIEWAYSQGKAYLLQARPITSLHAESDFEIMHELDTGIRTLFEYGSNANLGEVMPGSISQLGSFLTVKIFAAGGQRVWRTMFGFKKNDWCPYFERGFILTFNHSFMNLLDLIARTKPEKKPAMYEAHCLFMGGRTLDNPDAVAKARPRYQEFESSWVSSVKQIAAMLHVLLFGRHMVSKYSEKYKDHRIDLRNCCTAFEAYEEIERLWPQIFEPLYCLGMGSVVSMMYNMTLYSTLRQLYGGWTTKLFSDVAFLLNSCDDVESAEVPRAIQELAHVITQSSEKDKFQSMQPKDAFDWLHSSQTEAGVKFREFLLNHGHRCVKEFDVQSKTWGMDPLPLVKILKGMVGCPEPPQKKQASVDEMLSKLDLQIPWKTRYILKFLIPRCKYSVGMRERGKSVLIKAVNSYRQAYLELANKMVAEGRLPRAALIFHLTHHELRELLESRNPSLLAKAYRRENLFPYMDSLRFPEIISGIPKPTLPQNLVEPGTGSLTMHGTPVSQGVAIGTARVVNTLAEAANIQKGDILIAYCTDIGWTPYFPLLSGVATELGGLMSHGAIIAREYGLPCVIALHGATSAFHTGEKVILDANKGTITRVE